MCCGRSCKNRRDAQSAEFCFFRKKGEFGGRECIQTYMTDPADEACRREKTKEPLCA